MSHKKNALRIKPKPEPKQPIRFGKPISGGSGAWTHVPAKPKPAKRKK
jgi:hypothetical protein